MKSHTMALCLFAFAVLNAVGTKAADVRGLISETQKMSANLKTPTLVWWIPTEFWRMSLEENPATTEESISEIVETLKPYMMFVVAHGNMGPFGGVSWTGESELLSAIQLIGPKGETYEPLKSSMLSPDVRNLSQSLRPVLANMLGPMGENMQVVFFRSADALGAPLANALSPGKFSLRVMGESYRWRLPLGSLLPKKRCPTDGEEMSGAWEFCPWHGKKLKAR